MEAIKTYQVCNMKELKAWKTKLVEETKADIERNPEAEFVAKRIAERRFANASDSAFKTMNKLNISDDEKIVLLAAVFDARADPFRSPKRQQIDFTDDDEANLNYVHTHRDLFRVPIKGAHYAYGVQLKRREMSDERYRWLMSQQFENEAKLNIDDCPFEHISAYNCQKLEKLMKTKLPLVAFENKGVTVKPNLKSWREHWLKQGYELNTYKQLVYSIQARMDYEIQKLAIEANNKSVDNADKGNKVFIELIEENKELNKDIYDEEGFLNIYRAIHRAYPNLEVSRLRDCYLFLADYNKFASYSNVIKEYRKMKSESDVLDSYSFTWPQEGFPSTAHSDNEASCLRRSEGFPSTARSEGSNTEAALAQLHSTRLLLSAFRQLRTYVSRRRSEAEIRAVVDRLVDEALNQAVEEKQKAEIDFNENEEAMQAEDNNVVAEAEIKAIEPEAEAEIKTAEAGVVEEPAAEPEAGVVEEPAAEADKLLARMWKAPFSECQCYLKFLDTEIAKRYFLVILEETDDKTIETEKGNEIITETLNQMLADEEFIKLNSRHLGIIELSHLSGLLYRSLRDNEAIAVIRAYNEDIYKLYMSWAFDISISALELGVLYCTRAFGEMLITMIFKDESYKTLKSSEDIANVIDMMITAEDFNNWTTPQSRAAFEEIGGIDAKRKLEAIKAQEKGNEEFAEDLRAGAKEWAQEELALHPERYEQAKEETKQPRSHYKNDYRKHLPLSDKKGYVKSGDRTKKEIQLITEPKQGKIVINNKNTEQVKLLNKNDNSNIESNKRITITNKGKTPTLCSLQIDDTTKLEIRYGSVLKNKIRVAIVSEVINQDLIATVRSEFIKEFIGVDMDDRISYKSENGDSASFINSQAKFTLWILEIVVRDTASIENRVNSILEVLSAAYDWQ